VTSLLAQRWDLGDFRRGVVGDWRGAGGLTGALDVYLVLCLLLQLPGWALEPEEGEGWHPQPAAAVIHAGTQAAACMPNAHWVSRQDCRKPSHCFENLESLQTEEVAAAF